MGDRKINIRTVLGHGDLTEKEQQQVADFISRMLKRGEDLSEPQKEDDT